MKKKMILFILTGMAIFTAAACGSNETEDGWTEINNELEAEDADEEAPSEKETEKTDAVKETENDASSEAAEPLNDQVEEENAELEEEQFSFAQLKNQDFLFASGAGAWGTEMQINPDGSFEGQYHDSDMGSSGEGYPNGTMYMCNFSGQFTQPVKVDDYTYSMQIARIDYEQEVGTEEIKDGVLYSFTDAYGLDGAQNILIYLPGKPLAELSEEFMSWIGYYDLSSVTDTVLPFYALNNEAQEEGFVGGDIVEAVKQSLTGTEEYAVTLEQSIENDPLSQTELNEKAQSLYEAWDYVLNELWRVLKRTMDSDRMSALTDEQRAWITEKEQAVAAAGAEYEGGSMQPMVENLKASEMTKERVYELMEFLE